LYWDRNKKPSYLAGNRLLHYSKFLVCRGSFVWPPLYWWEETMNEEEEKIRKKRRRRRNSGGEKYKKDRMPCRVATR
jgi:hypothetical protein